MAAVLEEKQNIGMHTGSSSHKLRRHFQRTNLEIREFYSLLSFAPEDPKVEKHKHPAERSHLTILCTNYKDFTF